MSSRSQIKILLIDDVEEGYVLVRQLLANQKSTKYEIDFSSDLLEAEKHLINNTYDVYLVEYKLGNTNGIELFNQVKEKGFSKPAILFTAIKDENVGAEALGLGFADFLPKDHLNSILLERTIKFATEKHNYILEIQNREAELKSLLRFRELATSICRKFIKGHGDTLGDRVYSALGEIAEFLGVDRCRVYEITDGHDLQTYQVWTSPIFSGNRDALIRLEEACYPTLLEKLATKNAIEINRDRKSNLWETEIYEFVQSIGIEHMVLVPLFFNGEWLGALSLESHIKLEEGIAKRALIELVSEILSDVMERREKDNTLRKTKEEALKVSQLKTEFLSNMSHELRTPLNAILGMSEVLNDSGLSDEQKEYLAILLKSANSLKYIFDDIFEYAHLDSRPMSEKKSSFHFEDLIRAKVSKFKSLSEGSLTFNYEIDETLKSIGEGDQESLSRILDHLISNAVKFTEKGEVKVLAHHSDESDILVIKIIDSGVGIPEEEQKMIFDSFYQTDATLTKSYAGTGLGLTIVKRMLEILECKIVVESALNSGTTITFTFPFKTLGLLEQPQKAHS